MLMQIRHMQEQQIVEPLRGTTASDHRWGRKRLLLGPLCCPSPLLAAVAKRLEPCCQAVAGALRALCIPLAFVLRGNRGSQGEA
jgi:hypothetical protein